MDSDDDFQFRAESVTSPHLRGHSPSFVGSEIASSHSVSQIRASTIDREPEYNPGHPISQSSHANHSRSSRSISSISHPYPKPIPIPNRSTATIPHNLLPSAPASPPTPAPSPTPYQSIPSWSSAGENEDSYLRDARSYFSVLNPAERQRYLAELLNMCDSNLLSFVHQFVSPRLKKDPFAHLPNELCLRVRKYPPVSLVCADPLPFPRFFPS
jgi:F-box and WD-40 domain protein CDC4